MKIFSVIILLCFLISKGYTLTCYECDDCEKIDEKYLRECHMTEKPAVTTESPESTDPTSSTSNLSSTTLETSTSDGGDLTENSTNEGTKSSTESQTSEITSEKTPAISTEKSTTENNPSSEPTTESSTTTPDLPTESNSTTIIPNLSSTLDDENSKEEEYLMGEEYVMGEENSLGEENYLGGEKQWKNLRRVYRSIGRSEGGYGFSNACYSLQWKENGKTKVKRGCTEVPSELAACEIVKNQIQGYVKDSCRACITDKCNGSGGIKFSIFLLLVTLIVGQFYK